MPSTVLKNSINSSFSVKPSWCNSSYNSNRPVQNSYRGKEFNKLFPPKKSNDLCLIFCHYPSSMPPPLQKSILLQKEAYIYSTQLFICQMIPHPSPPSPTLPSPSPRRQACLNPPSDVTTACTCLCQPPPLPPSHSTKHYCIGSSTQSPPTVRQIAVLFAQCRPKRGPKEAPTVPKRGPNGPIKTAA